MKTHFQLNGTRLPSSDPKEILATCLSAFPNINYWSYDALFQYLKGTIENLQVYCDAKEKEVLELSKKVPNIIGVYNPKRYRYFVTWSNKLLRNIPEYDDANLMCRYIYNVILACEGLGLLPGYGMANKHGDRVKGNPEVKSIYGVEPFEIYYRRKSREVS